jgi:hypothetical protein
VSRYYPRNNTEYASVTTIGGVMDKPALLPWAVGCAVRYLHTHMEELTKEITEERVREITKASQAHYKEISAEAMDIGTRSHEAIHLFLRDQPYTITPDIENPFYAFVHWAVDNDLKLEKSEQVLYNDQHKYAGTCDFIGIFQKKRYIVDFKTSRGFYEPEMPMQLAAYAACVDGIEGIGVLRLDKETGMPEWKDYTDVRDKSFRTFLSALDIFYTWHAKKALRRG